jgi:hypothetical protein
MISTIRTGAAKQRFIECTKRCVGKAGSEILSYANVHLTPIRTGRLQNTAWVETKGKQADSVSVLISYGKAQGLRGLNPYAGAIRTAEPVSAGGDLISRQKSSYGGLTYALDVHETDLNYRFGRQWHYLSDAVSLIGEMAFLIGVQDGFR